MKCKSKGSSGRAHRVDIEAELKVEDVLSVDEQLVAGHGLDVNAIQQQ